MASPKTLALREITRPEPTYLAKFEAEEVKARVGIRKVIRWRKVGEWAPHTNPDRDRSLPGKARRRARHAAARLARRPFFKGYGIASKNAYNLRYECLAEGCGFGIVSPLDDWDFMADVMDHELVHNEASA